MDKKWAVDLHKKEIALAAGNLGDGYIRPCVEKSPDAGQCLLTNPDP